MLMRIPRFRAGRVARFLVPGLMVLCLGATELSAQAFNVENTRRYNIGEKNVPAFLAGFDSTRLGTKKRCVRANQTFTTGAGSPANSQFRYISRVDEIFDQQRLAVGVRVGVKYMGVGASVDSRYEQIESSASRFENGAIYAYFEKVDGVRFLSSNVIRLNPRGRRLHDEAVQKRDMSIFYEECGDEFIVGTQRASYVQAIGTLDFKSQMNESEKDFAIKTAVEVAAGVVDVSAEASAETNQKKKEAFEQIEILTTTEFTGNPVNCPSPNQTLASVTTFFACYTAHDDALTADLAAIYTVPYKDVIAGFGKLPSGSITHDREADVEKILDSLALFEMALFTLGDIDDPTAAQQRRLLRTDYGRALRVFVRNDACLKDFTLGCENLFQRFKSYPAPTAANARAIAGRMIHEARACRVQPIDPAITAWPLVNGSGRLNCRRCGIGRVPIFLDGKNAECGFVVPDPKPNVVRLLADELITPGFETVVDSQTGQLVEMKVGKRPDVCAERGKNCGRQRVQDICRERNVGRALRWIVAPFSPTYYADGTSCRSEKEALKPSPAACRTYGFIDCRCPKNEIAVGNTCSFVPVGGDLSPGFQNVTEPDEDAGPLEFQAIVIQGPPSIFEEHNND